MRESQAGPPKLFLPVFNLNDTDLLSLKLRRRITLYGWPGRLPRPYIRPVRVHTCHLIIDFALLVR